MKQDQLDRAIELNQKQVQLKARLASITNRTRPKGPNAVIQKLVEDKNKLVEVDKAPHSIKFTFDAGTGGTELLLPVPGLLAEKFLMDLERHYDNEAMAAEREFERL